MPFGIAATPQYFPDAALFFSFTCLRAAMSTVRIEPQRLISLALSILRMYFTDSLHSFTILLNLAAAEQGVAPAAVWRWLRVAHHGSQVPVRLLLVDRHGIQPSIRQRVAMVVSAVTRQTGRSYAKRRDEETRVQLSRHGETHKSDRKVLQCSCAATKSINVNALVSYIQVLISRTCDHLSFLIGTPRSHRSLPWALHLPSDHHAAPKLPIC